MRILCLLGAAVVTVSFAASQPPDAKIYVAPDSNSSSTDVSTTEQQLASIDYSRTTDDPVQARKDADFIISMLQCIRHVGLYPTEPELYDSTGLLPSIFEEFFTMPAKSRSPARVLNKLLNLSPSMASQIKTTLETTFHCEKCAHSEIVSSDHSALYMPNRNPESFLRKHFAFSDLKNFLKKWCPKCNSEQRCSIFDKISHTSARCVVLNIDYEPMEFINLNPEITVDTLTFTLRAAVLRNHGHKYQSVLVGENKSADSSAIWIHEKDVVKASFNILKHAVMLIYERSEPKSTKVPIHADKLPFKSCSDWSNSSYQPRGLEQRDHHGFMNAILQCMSYAQIIPDQDEEEFDDLRKILRELWFSSDLGSLKADHVYDKFFKSGDRHECVKALFERSKGIKSLVESSVKTVYTCKTCRKEETVRLTTPVISIPDYTYYSVGSQINIHLNREFDAVEFAKNYCPKCQSQNYSRTQLSRISSFLIVRITQPPTNESLPCARFSPPNRNYYYRLIAAVVRVPGSSRFAAVLVPDDENFERVLLVQDDKISVSFKNILQHSEYLFYASEQYVFNIKV